MNLNKHREYFDPEKIREAKVPIHIIGVGAIGSHIAIQLAKLGIEEITVWDFDTVDSKFVFINEPLMSNNGIYNKIVNEFINQTIKRVTSHRKVCR